MTSDELINQILSSPTAAQCVFHSAHVVTVHRDDLSTVMYRRKEGKWELYKLEAPSRRVRYDDRMTELGERLQSNPPPLPPVVLEDSGEIKIK